MKNRLLFSLVILFLFTAYTSVGQGMTNNTGFYMWDEATDDAVIEAAIAKGVNSFRSRDITILSQQSAWNVFSKYGDQLDVMVAIPVYYTYTTTPVNLNEIADLINQNPFIRRLQIYPKLQPGLMNPSELNPCNDWLTGYADEFDERIRMIDQLVTDKTVEIVVAGQMGTPGCDDLTLIINTLYELQNNGRSVAWAVTDYPFYYGNQDASIETLSGNIENILNNLAVHAPQGKAVLPLRIIETGWASGTTGVCSSKATQENQCTFANTAFTYSREGVKLYYFMLQDFADGWSDCEKHFGLYDVDGNAKCNYPCISRPVSLNPEGPVNLCEGESVLLYTNENPDQTYQWNNGATIIQDATEPSFMATTSGSYTVWVTNSANCTNESNEVIVNIHSAIVPVITMTGNTLHSSVVSGNQWYRDGVLIDGATAQDYTPDSPGSYTVVATVDGCAGESEPFNYVITANDLFNAAMIRLYPNPATDYITIERNGALFEEYEVLITDVVGKPVIQEHCNSGKGEKRIFIGELPKGNYYLRMRNAANEKVWHFVINR
ncbi:MAG TPA: T9SS type A sorting domain-containing protein [Cytophagaceae bacterium]